MSNGRISVALALSVCVGTSSSFAQTTRLEQIDQEKDTKAAQVQPETRESGDVISTTLENLFAPEPPAVRVTLGDFRPGAGLAAGIAYATPVGARALWTTSTAWSINNFKLVESRLDLPPLAADRLRVSAFARWDDAPALQFFGVGNTTSQDDEVSYGLETLEASAELDGRAGRWFRYGGAAGYLSIRSTDGTGSPSIISTLMEAGAPGLGSSPAWWHTSVFAAIDSRESPGYTASGGLYRLALHDYADPTGQFSFDRAEVDLRQFIPILHNNWIVAMQARADMTDAAPGQVVPYFMLPSIGGRDTIPGFLDYRFTDQDSLLLRAELRWTPSSVLDMAVFLDEGTVAPNPTALNLHDLNRGWGVGARLHGPTFTAVRFEIAHSVEGWRYNIAHSVSF
jgi:hypothetical protein